MCHVWSTFLPSFSSFCSCTLPAPHSKASKNVLSWSLNLASQPTTVAVGWELQAAYFWEPQLYHLVNGMMMKPFHHGKNINRRKLPLERGFNITKLITVMCLLHSILGSLEGLEYGVRRCRQTLF